MNKRKCITCYLNLGFSYSSKRSLQYIKGVMRWQSSVKPAGKEFLGADRTSRHRPSGLSLVWQVLPAQSHGGRSRVREEEYNKVILESEEHKHPNRKKRKCVDPLADEAHSKRNGKPVKSRLDKRRGRIKPNGSQEAKRPLMKWIRIIPRFKV